MCAMGARCLRQAGQAVYPACVCALGPHSPYVHGLRLGHAHWLRTADRDWAGGAYRGRGRARQRLVDGGRACRGRTWKKKGKASLLIILSLKRDFCISVPKVLEAKRHISNPDCVPFWKKASNVEMCVYSYSLSHSKRSTLKSDYIGRRSRVKGHHRATPRPQWGRSIHVSPQ